MSLQEDVDLLEQEIDNETAAIMKQRLGDNTRTGYERYNVSFMIWMFDNEQKKYHHLLQPTLIRSMELADSTDKTTLTKTGQPSKLRTHLRTICFDSLRAINKNM